MLLARLKPYDPRVGALYKTYSIKGAKFDAGRWTEVKHPAVAAYLKTVRQPSIGAPLAFDVATQEEAQQIDEQEAAARAALLNPASSPKSSLAPTNPHQALRAALQAAPQAPVAAPAKTALAPPPPPPPSSTPSAVVEEGATEEAPAPAPKKLIKKNPA